MVYSNIKKHHYNIKNLINKHKQLQKQQLNARSTITFLIKCRNTGITPNFIHNSTKNVYNLFKHNEEFNSKIDNSLEKLLENFHRKLLNILIRQKHEIVHNSTEKITKLKENINKHLTEEEQEQLWNSEETLIQNTMTTIKNKHKKKFEQLNEKHKQELDIVYNDKWFVNKTTIEFPKEAQWLLSLGEKYAIPTEKKNFPLFKMIADGEDCIQTIEDKEEQETARTKLTYMMENHINKQILNRRERFILSTVKQTRQFLRKNNNVLVLNADKGNVTVAMYKSDYDSRMCNILNNMMTYRRINKDLTSSLQGKNRKLVERLYACNNITEAEKRRLINDAATAPRIYGLPKIHKEGFPLRPICASVNSPSHELCKLLTNILKNLTKDSIYNVRDAVQFRNKLNNSAISEDEKLVSFDVVSLFTSIPVDFAIEVIMDKWDSIKLYTSIDKELFLEILKFCIKDSRYFKYNTKFYKQREGLPMGSPASPIVADIVMEELLKTCMEKLDEKPKVLCKYVDDLFGIVKESAIVRTLEELNKFHPQINFTMEEEKDEMLPYLDALIIRKNNIIKIDWYQKPTSSGRIINFYSCQPKNVVMNTADNLIKRVLSISDESFHKNNLLKVKQILKNNNFPNKIIESLIKNNKNHKRTETKESTKIFKTLTYVPGITERIKHANIFNKDKYQLAFSSKNTLRQLYSKTKSKLDKMDTKNLIYKISCKGNEQGICDQVYVGMTRNKLKTRISGHKSDYRKINEISKQKTALISHCALQQHKPNFENVEIIEREEKYKKLCTLEMLNIIKIPREQRMNFKSDVENSANIYRNIIKKKIK